MIRHRAAVALVRWVNLTFYLGTSAYCLLAHTPFTNEQFIKPHVSAGVYQFSIWHPYAHWLLLSITALTLAPHLERPRVRTIGWAYLGASVVFGVWLTMHPLWLLPGASTSTFALAFVAALPPLWLGLFDRVSVEGIAPRPSDPATTWRAAMIAAVFTWAVFSASAPLHLRANGGIDLSAAGLIAAVAWSALTHAAVFTVMALLLIAVSWPPALRQGTVSAGPSADRQGAREYWLLFAVWACVSTAAIYTVALAPISVTGGGAAAVAAVIAVSAASAWSGIARLRGGSERATALSAWLAPMCVRPSPAQAATALVALPLAAYGFIVAVSTFDWEFLVQKSGALVFWLIAFAVVHAMVEQREGRDRTRRPAVAGPLAAPVAILAAFLVVQWIVPRLGAAASDPRLSPEFIADAYAAVDPSFRVARETLLPGAPSDAADFYAYLRANSTLDDVAANAVDVTFHHPGARAKRPPPHIFLFIVDSLRRDYLSAYNPNVPFTPEIKAFADDSFVFRRAFSRYGGTGLAVPSIWAGAMLLHKQYVTPFAATNALEKLVDSNGYRRLITEDHISDELFTPTDDTVGLDHDVPEMLHTFCRSLSEVQGDLRTLDPAGRPVFAMTRPLDLHIGNIASARTPPGESYPGFYGPYAARVKRIDACFGEFIRTLKARGWYDDSIIVLTSDHGDSLGEGQRWGHGFTVFPEVLRIPLLVHLPRAGRDEVAADLGRLTFSVDITPTLYALVEGAAARPGHPDLVGSPLFVPRGRGLSVLDDRRRGRYLVASSYGGVYGLLSENGRRLYIADGIEGREYAYDLPPGGSDRRTGLTDAERDQSRRIIHDRIREIADWYGLTLGR